MAGEPAEGAKEANSGPVVLVFRGVVPALRQGRPVGEDLRWGEAWVPYMGELDAIVSSQLAKDMVFIVPPRDLAFPSGGSGDSRFESAALLTSVRASGNTRGTQFTVTVSWQVLDRASGRLVFDESFVGKSAFRRGRTMGTAKTRFLEAFQDALTAARKDPKFQAAIRRAKDGGTGTGTGIIVSGQGHILTAHHVIEGADKLEVVCGGKTHEASLVSASPTVDAALLKAEFRPKKHVTLVDREPALGTKVFTVGYPVPSILGQSAKYTEGVVSAVSGIADDAAMMQVTVPLQPGNSGGPLIDAQGNLVGMVVAVASAPRFFAMTGSLPQNIGFATKGGIILAAIPALQRLSRSHQRLRDPDSAAAATCLVHAIRTGGTRG